MDKHMIYDLLISFRAYASKCKEINTKLANRKIRLPNFPSELSENIVRIIMQDKCNIDALWDIKKGDLLYDDKKIEVKAFNSTGPISFGPTEDWWRLYILDCRKYDKDYFTCYEILLSNNDDIWKKIMVNKNQTYADQCAQKRRPRICFKKLISQIPKNKYNVINYKFII